MTHTTGLTIAVEDDGTYTVSEFTGALAELQAAVGGNVEPAPSDELVTIWVNEDGKFLSLPVNRLAMDVWLRWDAFGCMLLGNDWLAGTVVVTGGVDGRGETLDLPDEARRWVLRVAHDAGANVVGHQP